MVEGAIFSSVRAVPVRALTSGFFLHSPPKAQLRQRGSLSPQHCVHA